MSLVDALAKWTSKWIHPCTRKYSTLMVPDHVDSIDSFTATISYLFIELRDGVDFFFTDKDLWPLFAGCI